MDSIAYSLPLSQLFDLQVCLDVTDTKQPPSMSFEHVKRQAYSGFLTQESTGLTIQIKTTLMSGRRFIKLSAHCATNTAAPGTTSAGTDSPLFVQPFSTAANSVVINNWLSGLDSNVPFTDSDVGTLDCTLVTVGQFDTAQTSEISPAPSDSIAAGANLLTGASGLNPSLSFQRNTPQILTGMAQLGMNESWGGAIQNWSTDNVALDALPDASAPEPLNWPSNLASTPFLEDSVPNFSLPGAIQTLNSSLVQQDELNSIQDNTSTSASEEGSKERATVGAVDNSKSSPRSEGKRHTRKPRYRSPSLYKFHCPYPSCDCVFRSEYTCRVHTSVHKPKLRKAVPCTYPGCEGVFTRQHDRLRHEVSQHGKVCQWTCSSCDKFFSSEAMLQGHKCKTKNK